MEAGRARGGRHSVDRHSAESVVWHDGRGWLRGVAVGYHDHLVLPDRASGRPCPDNHSLRGALMARHAGGNLPGRELLIDSSNIKMFLRHYGTAGASFTVPAIDPVVFVRPLESGAGGGLRSAANGVADIGISGPASTTFSRGRCSQRPGRLERARRPDLHRQPVSAEHHRQREHSAVLRGQYRQLESGLGVRGLTSGKYAYNQSYFREGCSGSGCPVLDTRPTFGTRLSRHAPMGFASFSRFGFSMLGWRLTPRTTGSGAALLHARCQLSTWPAFSDPSFKEDHATADWNRGWEFAG